MNINLLKNHRVTDVNDLARRRIKEIGLTPADQSKVMSILNAAVYLTAEAMQEAEAVK